MEIKGGNGGLHGALENVRRANCWLIDVDSFYPSIMISEGLFPPIRRTKRFAEMLDEKRNGMKAMKLLLNSVYGLCDKDLRELIAHRGQDLLNMLIASIGGELIQVNTDGIIISGPDWDALKVWEHKTGMVTTRQPVKVIYQKNVNNYVFEDDAGNIIRKGVLSGNGIVNVMVARRLLHGTPFEESARQGGTLDYCEIVPCDWYEVEGIRYQSEYCRIIHVTEDAPMVIIDGQPKGRRIRVMAGDVSNEPLPKIDYAYYIACSKEVFAKWEI